MMKKIFVDMDGVLTDFNRKYVDMFDKTPAEVKSSTDRKQYRSHWDQFVEARAFAELEWHEGGEELVEFLNILEDVQLCVLTSAGGFERQREVADQKLEWLQCKGIEWPAVVVPGRRYKSGFATNDAFMIDDTPDVIKGFVENSGHGIVHKNVVHTINTLHKWLSPVDTNWIYARQPA